jgi:hypothetical protein
MLTWLSASNAVALPRETDAANISVSEPRDDDAMITDSAHPDESVPKPRAESAKTSP